MGYYLQTKFRGNLKGLSVFCVDLTWNDPNTKTFPKCYVGRNGKRNQQKLVTHISVWIAQDTTESRVP